MMSYLNPLGNVLGNNNLNNNVDDVSDNASQGKSVGNNAEKMVNISVPTAVSSPQHGSGCAHCMQDFIGQKVIQAKPSQVASLKSSAASKATSQAKANMKQETMRHEMAHYNKAAAAGLNPSAPVVNEDGSGHVNIQMPSLKDPNAKTKLQGAIDAALAPDNPSSQDQSVASKARSMLSQLGGKNSLAEKNQVGQTQKPGQSMSVASRKPYPMSSLAI